MVYEVIRKRIIVFLSFWTDHRTLLVSKFGMRHAPLFEHTWWNKSMQRQQITLSHCRFISQAHQQNHAKRKPVLDAHVRIISVEKVESFDVTEHFNARISSFDVSCEAPCAHDYITLVMHSTMQLNQISWKNTLNLLFNLFISRNGNTPSKRVPTRASLHITTMSLVETDYEDEDAIIF